MFLNAPTDRVIKSGHNSDRQCGVNQDKHWYERGPVGLVAPASSEVSGDGQANGTNKDQRCDYYGGAAHIRTVMRFCRKW